MRLNSSRPLPSRPMKCWGWSLGHENPLDSRKDLTCSSTGTSGIHPTLTWMQGSDRGRSPSDEISTSSSPYGASSGAKMAMNTRNPRMPRPTRAERLRKVSRMASRHRPRSRRPGAASTTWVSLSGISSMAMSAHPDLGVEDAVEDVGQQVDDHEGHGHHQREPLDDEVVPPGDGVEQRLAHAGDVEDRLGEDRPAQQRAQRQADDGDDRQHRVPQGVAADHQPLLQALGPGGADVVEAEHVQQAGAGHAG